MTLSREYGSKVANAVATGWFNRAVRLLAAEPEGSEHGYLYARQSLRALIAGDDDAAIELARRALEIGERVSDPNLKAFGVLYQGMALVDKGDVPQGLALIDEAAMAAVSGELAPMFTGAIYCNTIGTCCEIADYGRAGDWADAARRWCDRHAINGWPGDCRVHQAEILAMRGAWAEAEEAARRGAEELRRFNRLTHVGEALYQIGEIRLRVGDLPAAQDAFREASELGAR